MTAEKKLYQLHQLLDKIFGDEEADMKLNAKPVQTPVSGPKIEVKQISSIENKENIPVIPDQGSQSTRKRDQK